MKLGEYIQLDPWLRFMGPIGSKVIEVKGQIYVFFLLSRSKVKFLYLGSPKSDLHETW